MELDNDDVALKSLILAAADNVTRGTESQIDDRAPTAGRVFNPTDSDDIHIADGTQWVSVDDAVGILRWPPLPEDLTSVEGSRDGDIRVHDGSGTPSRTIAEWRSGDEDWYSYADASLFGGIV